MYNVLDIAKYIISESFKICEKENIHECQVTNLKLQFILYICQALYILKKDKPLFEEEILTGKLGPKNLESYYTFCGFGSLPISLPLKPKVEIKVGDRLIIDPVIKNFIKLSKNNFWICNHLLKDSFMSGFNNLYLNYGEVKIPMDFIANQNGKELDEKFGQD